MTIYEPARKHDRLHPWPDRYFHDVADEPGYPVYLWVPDVGRHLMRGPILPLFNRDKWIAVELETKARNDERRRASVAAYIEKRRLARDSKKSQMELEGMVRFEAMMQDGLDWEAAEERRRKRFAVSGFQ